MQKAKLKNSIKYLKLIKKKPGLNATQLSKAAKKSPVKTTFYTQILLKNKWISVKESGREKFYYPTPEGKKALKNFKIVAKMAGFLDINKTLKELG